MLKVNKFFLFYNSEPSVGFSIEASNDYKYTVKVRTSSEGGKEYSSETLPRTRVTTFITVVGFVFHPTTTGFYKLSLIEFSIIHKVGNRGFLPPANEVWGKIIFLHLFVILFTWEGGACVIAPGGRGVCVVASGGACMVAPRGRGACMVAPGGCAYQGGMCGCSQGRGMCGCSWGGMHGCSGVCMVAPRGACMVAPGGACMVAWGVCVLGGICGKGGHAW